MRYIALGCFSLFLVAAETNAAWLEASSDHFVIYGDEKEKVVKGLAERLERFHAAMGHLFVRAQAKPGPSNRVTVFIVSSQAKVREVTGTKDRFLAGVYIPGAGSSVALVPSPRNASKYTLSGETILYHEYAHHFMIANLTDRAFPRWFTEGFAEFFAGVRFTEDGTIAFGAPPYYRATELNYAREVPIRRLLAFDGGVRDSKSGYDSFYGQSWVLFHYLQMAPERQGALLKYRQLLAKGPLALEAAESAFGDLRQLEKDMESYMRRRRFDAMVVDGNALAIGPITMRKLRPGEAAMMPVMIESKARVTPEEARQLLPEARKVAALHPDDPAVLAALAEAEFDAGNDDAAITAADRAVAIDPKNINAHIQKGFALARQVDSGALAKESWKGVRNQFIKANSIEHDNPIPLVQFYLSYVQQGEPPTRNAIDGLAWAMELAPFDTSVRWLVAQQMVADERYREAARALAPLAYSAHPGEHTDKARQLLEDVETKLAQDQESSSGSLQPE